MNLLFLFFIVLYIVSLILYIDFEIITSRLEYEDFKRDFKTKSEKAKIRAFLKKSNILYTILAAICPWLNTVALAYGYHYLFRYELKYSNNGEKLVDSIIKSSKFSITKFIFKLIRKNGKKNNRKISNNLRESYISGKKSNKSRRLPSNNKAKK